MIPQGIMTLSVKLETVLPINGYQIRKLRSLILLSQLSLTPLTSTPSPNSKAAPIEILPTTTTVTEFSGSQSDYTAKELISLCEDVMQNSCVIEQGN